jgi:antitoxin component of MazEF toxin-antitoxin module
MVEDKSSIRKVQAYTGERSLTLVLPKNFATEIGIEKGDYIKVTLADRRIILERAAV